MKNIAKKFMTYTGVATISFGILVLVHKFIFHSEHWVLEPLTFMTGWVMGYLAVLVIKTVRTSKSIHINILCSIVVLTIAGAISLIFNTPEIHSYVFRSAFAFIFSIFANSLIISNSYSEEVVNEEDEEDWDYDDLMDDLW